MTQVFPFALGLGVTRRDFFARIFAGTVFKRCGQFGVYVLLTGDSCRRVPRPCSALAGGVGAGPWGMAGSRSHAGIRGGSGFPAGQTGSTRSASAEVSRPCSWAVQISRYGA
jgi:hypothetical protein